MVKSADFPLFDPLCRFTDDTVLTVATAHAILSGMVKYDGGCRRRSSKSLTRFETRTHRPRHSSGCTRNSHSFPSTNFLRAVTRSTSGTLRSVESVRRSFSVKRDSRFIEIATGVFGLRVSAATTL